MTEVKVVTILMADDNDDDIVLVREALEQSGVVNILEVVKDGEAAMAFLRREGQYRQAEQPGLLLLDINMPKKNGFEVLDEVKADPDLRHIPIVMLTVSDRDEEVLRAYRGGAASFIRKPVNFDEFQRIVKQFSLYWALVVRLLERS